MSLHTSLHARPGSIIHPRIIRLTHWISAAAMIIMIASGWEIYNAHPILPFQFPSWMTLGGWLGGALLWHFAAMWLLTLSFIINLSYGLLSGRFRAKLWPIRPRAVMADVGAALRGRLSHDLKNYNAVQKLLYAGVLVAIAVAIISGIALWKPVQFMGLTRLLGGFERARIVHFGAMVAISGFVVIHIGMALLVPASLRAMIRGR